MTLKAHAGRLRVHALACELAADAVRLARTFRGPGSYERGDQLVRAALSICSNIAEACGRGTVPEFRQFLLYARGSAQETVTHLRVAAALDIAQQDRKSTRLNSSHLGISYAVFCLKKKKKTKYIQQDKD